MYNTVIQYCIYYKLITVSTVDICHQFFLVMSLLRSTLS